MTRPADRLARPMEGGGAAAKVETVWAWDDLMNGLLVFSNVIGLLGLSDLLASAAASRKPKA